MSRARKSIDWRAVRSLRQTGAGLPEIARQLGIGQRTLQRRFGKRLATWKKTGRKMAQPSRSAVVKGKLSADDLDGYAPDDLDGYAPLECARWLEGQLQISNTISQTLRIAEGIERKSAETGLTPRVIAERLAVQLAQKPSGEGEHKLLRHKSMSGAQWCRPQ